ncbi:hypothetical protein QYM36_002837 [Artemia franciscana]|nr:hypothetical protein QYM36_002837 [Artemia franciscana]
MTNFKSKGGGTIVECTTHGIQRKAKFVKDVSLQSGVHVIAGTGFYVAGSQLTDVLSRPIEILVKLMTAEILSGCIDADDVKCGLIGEIGCSWPLHDFEKKVIEATALVQSELGCPVSFHPGRNPESPFEIIRIFQEAGGDVSKVAMSHLDRTIFDEGQLTEFAELGCYCEFDLFGIECSYYQLNEAIDMPSDAQRIQSIWQLVDGNFEDRILLSHDIHTKHRLTKFGGHGYTHIFDNVVPKMSNRGLSSSIVKKFLVDNPKAWLTFK